MRRLIPWIGWFYVAVGVIALLFWFFGHPTRWLGQAAAGQLSTLIAGGLFALIVFGILMIIGESDSRDK